jgi:hypothetical protein
MDDFIIKPSVDILQYYYPQTGISYIATSKYLSSYNSGSTVHFYANKDGREGLIAAGILINSPVMPRYVPAEYQKRLYAKDLRQFPIHFTRSPFKIFFDKKLLFKLPAMNMRHKTDLTKPDLLYEVYDLDIQINFIKDKYLQFLATSIHTKVITNGHLQLWFHQLREKLFERELKYIKTVKDSCSKCKMKHESSEELRNDFFEMHEKLTIDFDEKYRRISKGNFICVCPNCHKKEHEKILNSSSEMSLLKTKFYF